MKKEREFVTDWTINDIRKYGFKMAFAGFVGGFVLGLLLFVFL